MVLDEGEDLADIAHAHDHAAVVARDPQQCAVTCVDHEVRTPAAAVCPHHPLPRDDGGERVGDHQRAAPGTASPAAADAAGAAAFGFASTPASRRWCGVMGAGAPVSGS
jgi:hypothetical protein